MTNAQCAVNAELAMDTYTRITYGGREFDQLHPDDRQTALGDLLSDLMHLAQQAGVEFTDALEQAERHYRYEQKFDLAEEHV